MTIRRSLCGLLAALSLTLLGACYLPAPVPHAHLVLQPDGHCLLDGQPLALGALGPALAQRHQAAPQLVLELHISAATAEPAVLQAVQAAREAGVRVAFVKEDQAG